MCGTGTPAGACSLQKHCPAGDMFYISDRAHTLHFGPVWCSLYFFVVAAEAVGMWESLVLGFPHFHGLIVGDQVFLPESFHLQVVRVQAGNG
jgi:hypothetical protein